MVRRGSPYLTAATGALIAASVGAAGGGSTAAGAAARPLLVDALQGTSLVSPEATSACLTTLHIHCYSPGQLEQAYGLEQLHSRGVDGTGTTIVIVDSFGSPTIQSDLHSFDQVFGSGDASLGIPADPAILEDPTLTIIQPAGAPPPFDPTSSDMVGWAQETTLDVEWSHVFAPRAKILLVETPVSETEGVQGFPEIVQAENYVIDHGLGDVISQSFGATEETFPSSDSIRDLRSAFQNAARHGVTVLASSGDLGATSQHLDGICCYDHPVVAWPSSDPLVTSVGGTQLTLGDTGDRLAPDVVWNDGRGAGGGGPSHVFKRPSFQHDVKSVTGKMRGTPDISMSAAVDGGVWVYYTFVRPASPYHIFGGTSEASPEFAGIVAMADQVAGHRLGRIDQALYDMSVSDGVVDVRSGDNTWTFCSASCGTATEVDTTVTGFSATRGYDLASGLGTVDAPRFVRALAESGDESGG